MCIEKIICPYCGESENVKNGKVRHKDGIRQRFLCRKCNRNFYPNFTLPNLDKCRQAVILYLEGVSKEAIAKIIKVDSVTVSLWLKKYGKDLGDIRNKRIVRLDEIEDVYGVIENKSDDMIRNKPYKLIPYRNNFTIIEKQDYTHITQSKAHNQQKYKVQIKEREEVMVQHIINRDFR